MTVQIRPEFLKSNYVKRLPSTAVDVSDAIASKINLEYRESDNQMIRGLDSETPIVYYSDIENEFYVQKLDKKNGVIYKVLRWRKQKSNNSTYEYVLIPYKRRKPIKVLQSSWQKQIITLPPE
jgi:SPX domain protein involved in polyphosphate accumulation